MQDRHRLIQLKEQYEAWSKLPKYLLLADVLAQYLSEQNLPPGSRLLSIRQLAEKLDTTLVTLTRAVEELARRRLVERRQGSGIYTCLQTASPKKRIGIISPALTGSHDPQDGKILKIIYNFWHQHHYDICQIPAKPDEYEKVIIDYGLAGIIVLYPQENTLPYLRQLSEHGIPAVSIGNAAADFEGIAFGTDHEELARQAVNHLLDRGWSRIGFISSRLNDSSDRLYQRGYMRAMFDAGIPVFPDWDTVTGEPLEIALKKSAASGMLPEAFVLTSSGIWVSELCNLCRKLQIKLPQELVLVGLHSGQPDADTELPLTVFSQPLEKFTQAAMDSLLLQMTSGVSPSKPDNFTAPVTGSRSTVERAVNNKTDLNHHN